MGLSLKEFVVLKLSTLLNINLSRLALKGIGIGLPNDFAENGEKFLIKVILPHVFRNYGGEMVIFDVGANVGDYTENLSSILLRSKIYSFEPNPYTFNELEKRFRGNKRVVANQFALGSVRGKDRLYFYNTNKITGHASIHPQVFELHKRSDIDSSEICIETIDDYCLAHNISRIDFMKIDTEGYEYNTLLGAENMIKMGNINLIQFELNEMNIVSRVFLKDFYKLLDGYEFYRLKKGCLYPLKTYSSKEEIFIIQNILAVKKSFVPMIEKYQR